MGENKQIPTHPLLLLLNSTAVSEAIIPARSFLCFLSTVKLAEEQLAWSEQQSLRNYFFIIKQSPTELSNFNAQ